MALALAGVLAQAQDAAQEPSQQGSAPSVLDDGSVLHVLLPDISSLNLSLLTPDPQQAGQTTDQKSSVPDAPTPNVKPANQDSNEEYGKQNKRILWVIPNYRSVSANTK